MVFLAFRSFRPVLQILDALFKKTAFSLIGFHLGTKPLNFSLQCIGFKGCFRCFSGGCNSLRITVSVPVSILPPLQLRCIDTIGAIIQTPCAELPTFYSSRKCRLTETNRLRSFS